MLLLHPELAPDILVGVGLGCLLQMTSSQLVVKVRLTRHGEGTGPARTPLSPGVSPAAGARQPPGLDPGRSPGAEPGLLLRGGARAVLPAGQGLRHLPHPLLPGLPLLGPADRVQGDPPGRRLTGPAVPLSLPSASRAHCSLGLLGCFEKGKGGVRQ